MAHRRKAGGGAQLTAQPAVHDFGPVGQNQSLTTSFTITNGHTVPVEIVHVHKGCSCAEAEVEPKLLAPGAAGTLKVLWKTGQGRGRAGENILLMYQSRAADLLVSGQLPLRVAATVLPDIESSHEEIAFGPGLPNKVVVRLSPRVGTCPFAVLSATASRQAFRVAVDPAASSVSVEYEPELADPTNPSGDLMIQTDHPTGSAVRLPITVRR